MRVAIYTLGCKVNQYETQAMEQELLRRGHELVDYESAADAYIVNTCSVTAVSDKKSRQMIRRCRKQNPNAVVAACGCYVQTHAKEAAELDVDLIAGTGDRMAFLDLLEQAAREREPLTLLDDALRRRAFEVLPAGGMASRTRAMLKVEDGCTNFCTYCIIPYARGPVRSLPLEIAAEQARELRDQGYREIVVTGIEISSYGRDLPGGVGLMELLEAVSAAAGDMRIRLGSLEPRTVTEDFCRRAAALPNLCPHFHLSLQSGCNSVLKRMNRHYTAEEFKKSVELIRNSFDRPAITTDVIVGFPGETAEEFEECRKFVEDIAFYEMHVFKYSPRKGTVAAGMPDQLTDREKSARSDVLLELTRRDSMRYRESFISQELSVLWEDEEVHGGRRYMIGHTDRYVRVAVPEGSPEFEEAVSGSVTRVTPRSLLNEDTLLI